jgi:predicted ATPase
MNAFQGNMDKEFILERKDSLDHFIRQLAKYEFFLRSEDFTLFASYTGDMLERQIKKLKPLTNLELLAKYQKLLPI